MIHKGVFTDWGEYNNDYPDYKHDQANSRAKQRDSSGVGYSSLEEVQAYIALAPSRSD